MNYPKITVVTANYNQSNYLEQTIQSVISQDYPNLEYIIIDGGSTDRSVNIIKKYESRLAYWVSEKDSGLYHALQKGFEKSTGEIMGWLNSDDLLHPKSLFVIANIFSNNKSISWIQGHPTVFDETGMTVLNRKAIDSKYFFYLQQYKYKGSFIQQESTYWRRELWQKAGSYITQEYKYAGDFELWMRYYQYAALHCTKAMIGGFRVRSSQLSRVHYHAYLEECDSIVNKTLMGKSSDKKSPIVFIKKLKRLKIAFLYAIDRMKKLYSHKQITFDYDSGKFFLKNSTPLKRLYSKLKKM